MAAARRFPSAARPASCLTSARRSVRTGPTHSAFAGVPLTDAFFANLRAAGVHEPLPIQIAAAKRVFLGESVAIHSQTGSGKTFAYMVPLIARLQTGMPRQVLLCVPSRELALQSLECAHALLPNSAAMLRGSSSAAVATSMRNRPEPLLIATAHQLDALDIALSASEEALLTELRRTLRTVVLDEVDAIVEPRGKGGMLNRARRNRALEQMSRVFALRQLIGRRKGAKHARVQLVAASATLTKRNLRDLVTVVRRDVGKIGLVTPAMASDALRLAESSPLPAQREDGVRQEERLPNLEDNLEDNLEGNLEDWEARLAALESADASSRAAVDGSYGAHGEGFGVRGGVLRQGVPPTISHEIVVCKERRKTAVMAHLLASRPGHTLLVVRDGLRMSLVKEELRVAGVADAIELHALGAAAERHHGEMAAAGLREAARQISAAEISAGGRDAPDHVPAWAVPTARRQEAEAADADAELAAWVAEREAADEARRRADDSAAAKEAAEEEAMHEAAVAATGLAPLKPGAARWRLIVAHESGIRGLDLPQLKLVLLSAKPDTVESYIHIAGRTGRVGAPGRAVMVLTKAELDAAGTITRAIGGRWRVRDDPWLEEEE